VLTIVLTTLTLPGWDSRPGQIQELSTRLLVMGAVGIGTALLTRKLASQRDIAAAIQRESTRIDELNRLRGDFIASVSHDLKTPLTSAIASLGLLHMYASDRLEPDEQALLANARRNVDRLGMFIDDLISASQLTSGIMVLEREFLDLRDVVADAMGTLLPLMQTKSQVLNADLSEVLLVNGDRKRLGQVCMNLLANAHQHTPPGTIVEIAGHRDDSQAVLSITDNGPGIPAEALDDIFQPFYRLSNDAVGSGLGLANARRFIELHGGRLTAARAVSGGSIFQITLPIAHMQGGQ
jgi:signal transduction histidine kinase